MGMKQRARPLIDTFASSQFIVDTEITGGPWVKPCARDPPASTLPELPTPSGGPAACRGVAVRERPSRTPGQRERRCGKHRLSPTPDSQS